MKLGLGKLDCETVKLGNCENWTVKLGTVKLGLETVTGKLGL